MTIRKVEFTYKKRHLRYDSAKKVWAGYQIDVRAGGKRRRDSFPTRRDAEKFIEQLRTKKIYDKAGLKFPTSSNVRLSDLTRKRLARITNPKEVIRATTVFKNFGNSLEFDIPVKDIRTAHFQTFINSRLETGVKAETVNREMTILSTAFKQASELFPEELENYEPPRIPRPKFKKSKKRRRVITETEKDAILRSILSDRLKLERPERTLSRPAVAAMFELAWLLGLRFSEVKNLLKTDFNRDARSLRVVRWKTGDVDLLEFLPDRVMEILTASESTTETIFELHCSDHTFASILKDACEANNIVYGRSALDGVTFHSTRHSFTTRLIRVTDPATAASYTGHSSLEMVDYYSHASSESKKQAMEKMYGSGRREKLKEIFDGVRSGSLGFEQFMQMLDQ